MTDQLSAGTVMPVESPQPERVHSDPERATGQSSGGWDDSAANWTAATDTCFANLKATEPTPAATTPALAANAGDPAAAFLAVASVGLGCVEARTKAAKASLPSVRSALDELVLEIS
jgi:hypothetical protein